MGSNPLIDQEAGLIQPSYDQRPFAVKKGQIWPYLKIPGTCWPIPSIVMTKEEGYWMVTILTTLWMICLPPTLNTTSSNKMRTS